jgi:SARP family transcriptional regulator, regulator of embCAB operon
VGDRFQLTLLGSWQLRRNDDVVHVAARQQRLIAALALYGPRPRCYLGGLLWPESPEHLAMESLRVSVHAIMHQLPGLLVNSNGILCLSESVEADLHQVRTLVRELDNGRLDGSVRMQIGRLRDVELLPGWYDDWVLHEQARLRQARLHTFHAVAGHSLANQDYETALEAAEAAVELEPLYESAVRLLILAEHELGNNASALRAFERYRVKLKEEMGLAPTEALTRLVTGLRQLGP